MCRRLAEEATPAARTSHRRAVATAARVTVMSVGLVSVAVPKTATIATVAARHVTSVPVLARAVMTATALVSLAGTAVTVIADLLGVGDRTVRGFVCSTRPHTRHAHMARTRTRK